MPLEGVVHALHAVHAALAPGGILVDTQPVSAWAPVAAGSAVLGRVDMRDWAATIDAVDRRIAEDVASGRWVLCHEERLAIDDSFAGGPDCLAAVAEWNGARVPAGLARRLAEADAEVSVRQDVRLRLFRAAGP